MLHAEHLLMCGLVIAFASKQLIPQIGMWRLFAGGLSNCPSMILKTCCVGKSPPLRTARCIGS
jgi:hypothetical protein